MNHTSFPLDAYAVIEGWSAVEATGLDAGKFLQAFCTNDVLKLADGGACEAMFTDVKAHVLAYGWVIRHAEEAYTVLLASDRAERLSDHLDRYLIREKVELAATGGGAVTIGHDPSGWPLAALGEGITGTYGETTSPVASGSRLSDTDFDRLRIALGVPFDGLDVDERNLPQEVDRNEQAISFTKGCYLGQEPVARIDALGRVNWQLRGLVIEGSAPTAGDELVADEKTVGRVTSAVGTDQGSIAMAYVRREKSEPGTELAIKGSRAVVHGFPIPTTH